MRSAFRPFLIVACCASGSALAATAPAERRGDLREGADEGDGRSDAGAARQDHRQGGPARTHATRSSSWRRSASVVAKHSRSAGPTSTLPPASCTFGRRATAAGSPTARRRRPASGSCRSSRRPAPRSRRAGTASNRRRTRQRSSSRTPSAARSTQATGHVASGCLRSKPPVSRSASTCTSCATTRRPRSTNRAWSGSCEVGRHSGHALAPDVGVDANLGAPMALLQEKRPSRRLAGGSFC